jgi:glycosyltransferase involved in cell wall biosynthesis
MSQEPTIAILIPCLNEGVVIGDVVRGFRQRLPMACIYVYDNNSNDNTISEALSAGAIVRTEEARGKGNVVTRMFADIEADIYVMVDGDGTYDSNQAPELVDILLSGPFDMVNGKRIENGVKSYRFGHRFGNTLLTRLVGFLFKQKFTDMLSGYKLFSRRFVKSFPAQSDGFEIETQLTVHALRMKMPVAEVDTCYGERAEGANSKLETWRDGLRILLTIIRLFKNERPFGFFGLIALTMLGASIFHFVPILGEFIRSGLVPRLPTLIVISGFAVCSGLSLLCGIVLQAITKMRQEQRRLHYLSIPMFHRSSTGLNNIN